MAKTKTKEAKGSRRPLKRSAAASDEDEASGDEHEEQSGDEDPDFGPIKHLEKFMGNALSCIMTKDKDHWKDPDKAGIHSDFSARDDLKVFGDPTLTTTWEANKKPEKKGHKVDAKKVLLVKSGKEADAVARVQRAIIIQNQHAAKVFACLVETNNQQRQSDLMAILEEAVDCLKEMADSGGGKGKTRRMAQGSQGSDAKESYAPWTSASARFSWVKEQVALLNSPRYDDEDYIISQNIMRLRMLGNTDQIELDPDGYRPKVIAALLDKAGKKNL